MKNHHISEDGVSFENIVWSVYQDMGWRTHFLHMAANYRLKYIHSFIGIYFLECTKYDRILISFNCFVLVLSCLFSHGILTLHVCLFFVCLLFN